MMQPVSYRLLDLTSFDGVFFVLFFVLSLVLIMSPTLTRLTEPELQTGLEIPLKFVLPGRRHRSGV